VVEFYAALWTDFTPPLTGFIAEMNQLDEIINISPGYVHDNSTLIESVNAPPNTHSLAAHSSRGSGVFDQHGNIIGLVYSSSTANFLRRFGGENTRSIPNHDGSTVFIHGLDAIVRFLVDNNIDFGYQVFGKSVPMQGNGGNFALHGYLSRITYMVLCQSSDL
jgi:hypothetical protein